MAQESLLLAEKVKMIYEILCHSDKKRLAELLSDVRKVAQKPHYLKNRPKSLDRIMREGSVNIALMRSEFDHMPIARLQLEDGSPLFEKAQFFGDSLEAFRLRLERYRRSEILKEIGIDPAYRYLYLFDHRGADGRVVIERYDIDYLNLAGQRGVGVRLYPKVCGGEVYKGSVQGDHARVYFTVQNSQDSMLALFNTALESGSQEMLFDKALYGVAAGIDDANRQIVVAKKVALMQRILDEEQLQRLYLVLNETQKIEAHENRYALEHGISLADTSYLRKYNRQIMDLHRFFSTLKYNDTVPTTLRDHMVFAEFYPFCMLYEKYAADQNFFLSDRKRVMLEVLRYIRMYPPGRVRMVLPLDLPQENIFLYTSVDKESVYTLLMEQVYAGVAFEIVFVITRPQDYKNAYMEGVFAQLREAGVWFGFVDRQEIASEVNYRDFIYTEAKDVAIIKDHPAGKEVFTITREKAYIEGCIRDFAILREAAVGYEDVMDEACVLGVHDRVLRRLMGRWYGYFYGSAFDSEGAPRLWEMVFEIANDCSVIERRDGRLSATGDVMLNPRQSLLMMQTASGKSSYHFVFDPQKIDEVFHVMGISQHLLQREHFASMGIFSRRRLALEEARVLLGEPGSCMMVPEPDAIARLQAYRNQLRVSSLSQVK